MEWKFESQSVGLKAPPISVTSQFHLGNKAEIILELFHDLLFENLFQVERKRVKEVEKEG